jgi:hypothetical protein
MAGAYCPAILPRSRRWSPARSIVPAIQVIMSNPPQAKHSIMPDDGLSGWTELPYMFTFPPAAMDDLADRGVDLVTLRQTPVPPGQWYRDAETGHLVCKGDSWHSWLRYDRPLGDYEAHVEWRFRKLDRPDLYNSGVFVRNDPALNVMTQIETRYDRTSTGFMFSRKFAFGQKHFVYGFYPSASGELRPFDPHVPDNPTLVHPPGQWNSYDIRVVGRDARVWTNGGLSSVFELELEQGYFGLEAERYWIEFRNLRLTEL